MEHKWRDEMMRADFVVAAGLDRPLTITALVDGTAVEQPETLFAIPGYFVREFFRLAKENERLSSENRWLGGILGEDQRVREMRALKARLAEISEWLRRTLGTGAITLLARKELEAMLHVTPPAQEAEEHD